MKRKSMWLLSLIMALLLACPAGLAESGQAEIHDAASEPARDPTAEAMELYRQIVAQAPDDLKDALEYATPTGYYRYALVLLQQGDTVPTLLIEQEGSDYLYYMYIFRYDPLTGSVIHPSDTLMEGASEFGYRANINLQPDGNGLQFMEWGGAAGDADMDRVTLDGESFRYESQWSGILTNMPEEYVGIKIDWHDIGDTTALGVPAPAQDGASQTAMPGNTPMPVVILTPASSVDDSSHE